MSAEASACCLSVWYCVHLRSLHFLPRTASGPSIQQGKPSDRQGKMPPGGRSAYKTGMPPSCLVRRAALLASRASPPIAKGKCRPAGTHTRAIFAITSPAGEYGCVHIIVCSEVFG